jgi:hypothetical protein
MVAKIIIIIETYNKGTHDYSAPKEKKPIRQGQYRQSFHFMAYYFLFHRKLRIDNKIISYLLAYSEECS